MENIVDKECLEEAFNPENFFVDFSEKNKKEMEENNHFTYSSDKISMASVPLDSFENLIGTTFTIIRPEKEEEKSSVDKKPNMGDFKGFLRKVHDIS